MLKLILLINLFFSHPPDEYFVAHIHGKIYHSGTNNVIKLGEKINLDQALDFTTESDFLAVISPARGRFLIRKNKGGKRSSAPRILVAISDNLVPATLPQTLAGRGNVNSPADLKMMFNNLAKKQQDTLVNILLIDSVKLELEGAGFNERDSKFFFIRYDFSREAINKKLNFMPGTNLKELFLVIDKGIFLVDGKSIDPGLTSNLQLFYYNASERSSDLIGKIKIILVEKNIILQEIGILQKNLRILYEGKKNQNELIRDAIFSELENNYGYIDRVNILALLSTIKN